MRTVMDEPAIRFFTLLNEAYRLDARNQIKAIAAATMGMADTAARQKHVDGLQRVSDGILPGDNNNDYSGINQIKNRM